MTKKYWIRGSKGVQGPFDQLQIRGLVAVGEFTPSMEISLDGAVWQPASKVKGLFPSPEPQPIVDFETGETVKTSSSTSASSQQSRSSSTDRSDTATAISSTSQDKIDKLAVSDVWKKRFRHLEAEPKKPQMNILGFLFGFFYYLAKGLWRKGIVLLVIGLLLSVVLELIAAMFGKELSLFVFAAPMWALFGLSANQDVYRKEVHGELFWPAIAGLGHPAVLLTTAIPTLLGIIFIEDALLSPGYTCSSPEVLQLVREIIVEAPYRATSSDENFIKQQGKITLSALKMDFDGIQTLRSVHPDSQLCTATLRFKTNLPAKNPYSQLGSSDSINYQISTTDDGRLKVDIFD